MTVTFLDGGALRFGKKMDQEELKKAVREIIQEKFRAQERAKEIVAARPAKINLAKENIARWLGKSSEEDYLPTRKEIENSNDSKSLIPNPKKPENLNKLLRHSPARLGVWRAGTRYLTEVALKLRADHAVAKDAVYAELKDDFAGANGWIPLHTKAKDKDEFLLRPDLGRVLNEQSLQSVKEKGTQNADIQIIVADGLSPWAAERYAPPLVKKLTEIFRVEGLSVGQIFCVKYSRIAIQDVIGEALNSKLSMILLGERPGLGSGDSLSNYMIYGPKVGAVNADKSMISNIHPAGYNTEAAAKLTLYMVKKMFEQKCSGINLKI